MIASIHEPVHRLLVALALTAIAAPPGLRGEDAASPAPAAKPSNDVVPWSDVAAAPCRFQGQTVRLRIQLESLPARWQPGPTRFGPGAFGAVRAWSDEQRTWIAAEYAAPAVRLFFRHGGAAERAFAQAHAHERFDVVGTVREVWDDRPWIELHSAVPLAEEIGEAAVIHAARALRLIDQASWKLAGEELQQALSSPLPGPAREELEGLRAACQEQAAPAHRPAIRPH